MKKSELTQLLTESLAFWPIEITEELVLNYYVICQDEDPDTVKAAMKRCLEKARKYAPMPGELKENISALRPRGEVYIAPEEHSRYLWECFDKLGLCKVLSTNPDGNKIFFMARESFIKKSPCYRLIRYGLYEGQKYPVYQYLEGSLLNVPKDAPYRAKLRHLIVNHMPYANTAFSGILKATAGKEAR